MPLSVQAPGEDVVAARLAAWTQGYAPLPGIPDEFIGVDGAAREHWLRHLRRLAALDPKEIEQRFSAADRRVRDRGMSYRVYGENTERVWPLSRMPLLIPEAEWGEIARGIAQRAELLERVLTDIYGPAALVAEGALPAAALTGSRDYLGVMRGVIPPGKRRLRLYAADLGRGPDGRWWVLGDRVQAPSGSGYSLENRLVVSQAFPELYRDMNVQRLAPFFREFREGLRAGADRNEPRICILTPGAMNPTYFEQAYLARYLGFLLVEGDDLSMREGRVYVRTIAGLKRADAIWRHVDADWCDPLELNPASRIGVPGLMEAIRVGGVSIENVPGAGVVESRAMMAFLPSLARRVLGEDLILPNLATWWCGQPREREKVLADLERIAIAGAFSETTPGLAGRRTAITAEMSGEERKELAEAIARRGVDYVGQEIVRLSTTPRWENGRLVPRPFVLRVFAAATPEGWRVMPGGFCRIGDRADARAVTMGEGVESADVWVLSEAPVETTTLLPQAENARIVRLLGNLPSRAADNLFWFGRYIERTEATLRLIRALCTRAVDPDGHLRTARRSLDLLKAALTSWSAVEREALKETPAAQVASRALTDPKLAGSALSIARAARASASVIRERLTQRTWSLIAGLEVTLASRSSAVLSETGIIDVVEEVLTSIAALAGLFDENFNRGAGWVFYELGRRIERGINTCSLAQMFAADDASPNMLDALLDLIDSQITYRSRYLFGASQGPVRDMALLDPFNPRSVAFQVNAIDAHLGTLPELRRDAMYEEPRRIATLLHAELSTERAEALNEKRILEIENRLSALADAVAARYFLQGAAHARSEKVTGLE